MFVLARRQILGIDWRSDIYPGCANAEMTAFRGRSAGRTTDEKRSQHARPTSDCSFHQHLPVVVLCAVDCATSFAVWIHLDFAFVVENHQGAFFSSKRWPF